VWHCSGVEYSSMGTEECIEVDARTFAVLYMLCFLLPSIAFDTSLLKRGQSMRTLECKKFKNKTSKYETIPFYLSSLKAEKSSLKRSSSGCNNIDFGSMKVDGIGVVSVSNEIM
jgi:hypothetical protein